MIKNITGYSLILCDTHFSLGFAGARERTVQETATKKRQSLPGLVLHSKYTTSTLLLLYISTSAARAHHTVRLKLHHFAFVLFALPSALPLCSKNIYKSEVSDLNRLRSLFEAPLSESYGEVSNCSNSEIFIHNAVMDTLYKHADTSERSRGDSFLPLPYRTGDGQY